MHDKSTKQGWKKRRERFYKDITWMDCSDSYRKAHPLCERCLKKHVISPSEETHHKIKLTPENIDRPEIVLNWDNLEALCRDCHKKEHGQERKEKKQKNRRWRADPQGNIIITDSPL